MARARHGTNVNESAHRMAGKQSDKLSERARRVTDGQHHGSGVMLHLDWPIPGRQRIDLVAIREIYVDGPQGTRPSQVINVAPSIQVARRVRTFVTMPSQCTPPNWKISPSAKSTSF